jgi:acetyl-CoA/propionyl-CoA carboxylase biotin carboxyl carrier protein
MDDVLTPRQVAAELGVTVRTVQRWIADGRLPAERIGGRVRVSRSSLAGVASGGPGTAPRAIRSLLIANRGEIAVRIARTARRMGIRAVGVHTADERAPDGVEATEVIASYLDPADVLRAAARSAAEAVHPGYGFLAENSGFARAVADAGLTWIGPPPKAIAAMGDKAAARRRAASLGVPIIPGYDGDGQDDATLGDAAERIGYPVLVKPAAGGGGKGMHLARDAASLRGALETARREARTAFGDARLILERHLGGSRHVEVQVLFDSHGNGVHLGERDCSAQRRNQKIVEEAPAPFVSPELRERMGAAAVSVAASVGYVGAGTVEMLVMDEDQFFFLEMNTRLQVEHPVTEAVIGRDLVEEQLRIAAGETLAQRGLSAPPSVRGHAVEARLYAEDAESGFLPAAGGLARIVWPREVRVDTGVREGDAVSDRYDPLLAKLIAHGATRREALDRMRAALRQTMVLGVRTNLRFLRWLLDQPPMREGRMRTDTIAGADLPDAPVATEAHWQAAAGMLRTSTDDPWSGGWRLNAPSVVRVAHERSERTVPLSGDDDEDGGEDSASAVRDGDVVHVDVDGQSLEFRMAPAPTIEVAVQHASAAGAAGSSVLTAPMPGRVLAVRATEGASVRAHEPVVIIEAMKMEHAVVAPVDGTLRRVAVREGQQVQRGEVLGTVEATR